MVYLVFGTSSATIELAPLTQVVTNKIYMIL